MIAGVCVLALLAVLSWAALTGVGEPERPAAAGTTSGATLAAAPGTASISASASPSPSPSPSVSPSPSSSTTTPAAAAPAPRPTTTTPVPPRTAGPNERVVPDMVGKNIVEATYTLSMMSLM
jgi:cytoskeletal protein RodZ